MHFPKLRAHSRGPFHPRLSPNSKPFPNVIEWENISFIFQRQLPISLLLTISLDYSFIYQQENGPRRVILWEIMFNRQYPSSKSYFVNIIKHNSSTSTPQNIQNTKFSKFRFHTKIKPPSFVDKKPPNFDENTFACHVVKAKSQNYKLFCMNDLSNIRVTNSSS